MVNETINTKISDMSGNPFVCVHQTQNAFDEFDDEHMGSGNFGPGHYFCIEANYWDGFGVGGLENKNCYLIMQNPYDNSKKVSMKDVIKLAKMEDYVKELQANGGRINLNYKDTLRRVIDELFFTNLSYVVGLGINTNDDEMFAWKDQVWGKVVDGLKQQGYDGLVEKTPLSKGVIVVAWYSNSICQVPEKPKVTESNFKSYTKMKDVIGKAMGLMKGYLEAELNKLPIMENVRYYDDVETLENPSYNEFKHFMKPRKWYRMVIDDAENKVFVWDANTSLLHQEMDDIHNLKESLHLFIHNGKPYLQDYDLDDYNLSNKEEFYVIAKSYDESQLFKKYFPKYSIVNDLKKAFENNGKYIAEGIVHAEMNDDDMVVILHNPTRKELKDNDLDDECRLVYDGNNGYYFASSVWTHEQIEQKLQAKNLPYAETSGEFYYYQDNLFATRDDWSSEEEYQEYKNDWYQSLKSMPYIVKNFGNFKVEIFQDEYLNEEINEVLKLAGVDLYESAKLNDNFWKWFGDSKMKNKKGEPIPFYHTTYSDISVFEPVVYNKGKFTPSDKGTDHFHFSKYKEWTDNFAKDEFSRSGYKNRKTYEVYLKIENPLVILPIEKTINDWVKYLNSKGINISLEELLHMSTFGNDFDDVKTYRLPKGLKKEEKDKWLKNAIEQEKQWYASKKCQFWKVIRNSNKVLSSYCKEAGFDGILMRDTNRNNAKNLTVIVFDSNQIKSINNNGNWSEDSNNINEEKGFIEEQILTEAVNQHSLYHGCDLAYAVSMMIDNAMRGETIANINGKKYQGNSLTRSLQFAKDWQEDRWGGHGDELNNFWVVLELNKERLKTKYKVLPYNYWEEYFGKDYVHTIDRNGYGDQYEEFVVGKINNLRNYLDDVYLSPECFDVEYAEIFAIVKRELELRGENCSDSDIDKALQTLGIDKPSPDDFDGEALDETIAHAERSEDYYDDSEYQDITNVILKNPSRKELEECGMIECRIAKDWDDNFYFANSYDMIHTDIVEKLESENIKSVETNLFYDTNSNTFYYNVGHLTDDEIEKYSEREEKYLRQSLYISKTFKDFHFKITFGEL